METIEVYLENIFLTLPKNKETLKIKKELFSMMEDKYNELKCEGKTEDESIGIVISEFGSMDEILKNMKKSPYHSNKISLIKTIHSIVWAATFIIYLMWSYLGQDWSVSWIIFIIAPISLHIINNIYDYKKTGLTNKERL